MQGFFSNAAFATVAVLTITAAADAQIATRRASIVGNRGGEGKCTIEVRVDGAADVEVSGDMGRIRNLEGQPDRKSTRLNSSHANISYAVFCLKKKKKT